MSLFLPQLTPQQQMGWEVLEIGLSIASVIIMGTLLAIQIPQVLNLQGKGA